jgi:hypothetical protein
MKISKAHKDKLIKEAARKLIEVAECAKYAHANLFDDYQELTGKRTDILDENGEPNEHVAIVCGLHATTKELGDLVYTTAEKEGRI